VDGAVPIYSLYALLFARRGLDTATISMLFAVWSLASMAAEVPTGALADRFSRRQAIVASGVVQGAAFGTWLVAPNVAGFAAGFVLWGVGGALASGATEALVYDGLAAHDATDRVGSVLARMAAANLIGQVGAAGAAVVLVAVGGFSLALIVSVAYCLFAAALAAALPEAGRVPAGRELGFGAVLRTGLRDLGREPAVRWAAVAMAAVSGLDAAEEYFPLLAHDWGVATTAVPISLVAISLAGALGAGMAGRAGRLDAGRLALTLLAAAAVLAGAALVHQPAALGGVAVFYGLYRLVLVGVETEFQHRIDSAARATAGSAASLLGEVMVFAVYASWTFAGAFGGAVLVALAAALVAALR
jgi:MFS family permease